MIIIYIIVLFYFSYQPIHLPINIVYGHCRDNNLCISKQLQYLIMTDQNYQDVFRTDWNFCRTVIKIYEKKVFNNIT